MNYVVKVLIAGIDCSIICIITYIRVLNKEQKIINVDVE